MSLHKWNRKEWMPPWWVTSHKLNKTLFIEYKRMKYMKPDSRTSLLEISMHIYTMSILNSNLNRSLIRNNNSNKLIRNLMKKQMLLIL